MLLKATNIHKTYSDGTKDVNVLQGIDIFIDHGETLAIVGPSGAGKSTLLHILGGLDRPDQGEVVFDGDHLYDLPERGLAQIRNQDIGFIFQFYHLLPELTAWENVVMPAMVKNNLRDSKSLYSKGLELLERVGLSDRADHKPNQLSGGEQQRVAIARALINDPKVILCDEPTGNLDSQNGQAVIELLLGLNRSFRQSLVMVTHDQTMAQKFGRIVHIQDGLLRKA